MKNVAIAADARGSLSAKQARGMWLSGAAPIIRDTLRRAIGEPDAESPGVYFNVDEKARKVVLDAIIPMMQAAGDIQKVTAASTADILELLKTGSVTFQEAIQLMSLVKDQFEMTELRTLSDKLEAIQNPSSPNLSSVG